MPVSTKTIAILARPFEGGNGPGHSFVDLAFASADAAQYTGEGSKIDKVLGGLQGLRNGVRTPDGAPLPADHEKLTIVASQIAARLVSAGLVDPAEVADALDAEPAATSPPPPAAPRAKQTAASRPPATAADSAAVMVVHGQDAQATKAMFDWLRSIGLKPQQWNQLVKATGTASPFIGQVLEAAFAKAQAVVVLLTPDEHVLVRRELSSKPSWRMQARPNVLFEAGMAFAAHPERTVLAVLGDQELPSDLAGRHYVRIGNAASLRDLALRLEQAGCPVDLSGDDWLDTDRFPGRDNLGADPT